MARLGHSTVGAALRYQHTAKDRDKAIAETLSNMATNGDPARVDVRDCVGRALTARHVVVRNEDGPLGVRGL